MASASHGGARSGTCACAASYASIASSAVTRAGAGATPSSGESAPVAEGVGFPPLCPMFHSSASIVISPGRRPSAPTLAHAERAVSASRTTRACSYDNRPVPLRGSDTSMAYAGCWAHSRVSTSATLTSTVSTAVMLVSLLVTSTSLYSGMETLKTSHATSMSEAGSAISTGVPSCVSALKLFTAVGGSFTGITWKDTVVDVALTSLPSETRYVNAPSLGAPPRAASSEKTLECASPAGTKTTAPDSCVSL
mmetsp:Transcript_11009/g.45703  ORF Transcript_11009/g.45703 Transcript_11009/m.45703 type:complete len:251 (-) Transcript_11009:2375-3127(-)